MPARDAQAPITAASGAGIDAVDPVLWPCAKFPC
jgi:hypothetical protein